MRKIDINKDEVITQYSSGIAVSEIAKNYNCSVTTIREFVKQNCDCEYENLKRTHIKKIRPKNNEKYVCKYEGCNKYTYGETTKYCPIHQTVINNQKIMDEIINNEVEGTIIRKNNIFVTYKNKNYFSIMIPTYNCLCLVSKKHFDKIIKLSWHMHKQGYVETKINRENVLLHRLLFENPNDVQIDHINRNKFDCRDKNLRVVNKTQNSINKSIMSNNTSGVTGVAWDKERNKWHVMISMNHKNINLGRYVDFEDAVKVRLKAEELYHKDYSPSDIRKEYKTWLNV